MDCEPQELLYHCHCSFCETCSILQFCLACITDLKIGKAFIMKLQAYFDNTCPLCSDIVSFLIFLSVFFGVFF